MSYESHAACLVLLCFIAEAIMYSAFTRRKLRQILVLWEDFYGIWEFIFQYNLTSMNLVVDIKHKIEKITM